MHAPRRDYKDALMAKAAPGEPFVWLTSMGLALSILMVVGLLAVIVLNGLPVFWPNDAVVARLKEGVTSPVPNTPEIIGEIAQERTKSVKVLGPDGKPLADQTEIQFFVGNKDTYGFSFVYLDSNSIASIERPKNSSSSNGLSMASPSAYPSHCSSREASASTQVPLTSMPPSRSSLMKAMLAARRSNISRRSRSDASMPG